MFKNRIKHRHYLKTFSSLGVLTLLILVVAQFYETNKKRNLMSEVYKSSIEQLANNISLSLKVNDSAEINRLIRSFVFIKKTNLLRVESIHGRNYFVKGNDCVGQEFNVDVKYNSKQIGQIIACSELIEIMSMSEERTAWISFLILIIVLLNALAFFFIKNTSPLYAFIDDVEKIEFDHLNFPHSPSDESNEALIHDLYEKMNHLVRKIKRSKEQLLNEEKTKQKYKLTRQIAHDIRSPLEALKSVANSLDGLDYSTKKIISNSVSRISDIANGLLKASQDNQDELEVGSFRILIEDIVADKKFEKDAHIIYKSNSRYKDSFIKASENKLYRAISNIINNAIEAQESKPRVDIIINSDQSNVQCSIIDSGKGMNAQMIHKALEGGVTTKEKGNGLGLSYANKVIKEHGGSLEIKSVENEGTTVTINLPKIETPSWFTDEINISSDINKIICVDDDPSFLELYREKLGKFEPELTCLNEKSLDQVVNDEKTIFFVDFDLGLKKTGLDIILKNELKNVILVTSMHQDSKIQKQCIEYGIKILPKQVFNNAIVSISKDDMTKENTQNPQNEIILIDDDELMHMSWKMAAEEKNQTVYCYYSIDSFLKESEKYSKDIPVYVDSNLSDDIKGEVESERIYKKGFKYIYLATGYNASDIVKPSWIIKIVGKRPEFN